MAGVNISAILANVAITSYCVTSSLLKGDYSGAAKELLISLIINKLAVGASAGSISLIEKNLGSLSLIARGGKTVTLFRAVEVAEYESIIAGKIFSWGPRPTGMKQFAFTMEEAIAYANTNPAYVAIIKVTINDSAVSVANFSRSIDPWIFKNGVLTFSILNF
ncbi:MAG: hypothetical protein IPO35_12310 [Uliginosibacterium sp.]|nr:hypothetical protein [Uliginosibacterium sp.]